MRRWGGGRRDGGGGGVWAWACVCLDWICWLFTKKEGERGEGKDGTGDELVSAPFFWTIGK